MSDPQEHVAYINTHMTIIGANNFLKCKILYRAFKNSALRWYMNLPRFSVTSYQDLVKKLIH